jgi:beta-galactosidase
VKQDINIFQPQLWSPNSPVLYVLETIVKVGGRTVDVYNTTFGVRTAKFDPNRGFLLNGEQVKLQGSMH